MTMAGQQRSETRRSSSQQRRRAKVYGKRRPNRRQSLRRVNYKKSASDRIDDIPDCPLAENVFHDAKTDDAKSLRNVAEDTNNNDPYEGLPAVPPPDKDDDSISSPPSSASSTSTLKAAVSSKQKRASRRRAVVGKHRSHHSVSAPRSAAVVSVREEVKKQHRRPSPGNIVVGGEGKGDGNGGRGGGQHGGEFGSIRRQLKVAILERSEHWDAEPLRPSVIFSTPSSMASSDHGGGYVDDDDEFAYSSESGSMSSQSGEEENEGEDGGGMDDSFDCCVQFWNLMAKLMMLLFEGGNYVLDHKLLFYPLAVVFLYLCLGLLHSIIASIMASLAGWVWPPAHFILSTTAGFVWRLADWLSWIDELGRSLICDMAASYCRRYRLLCDRQCSFVDRAVEHAHARRSF